MLFVQRTFRQTSNQPFYKLFPFVLNLFSILFQSRTALMCNSRERCNYANYFRIHVQTVDHLTSINTSDTPYLETASWLEASSRQIPPTVVPSSVWSSSPGGGESTRRKLSDCFAKPKLLESILPIGMLTRSSWSNSRNSLIVFADTRRAPNHTTTEAEIDKRCHKSAREMNILRTP